jgi:hypothetical protein
MLFTTAGENLQKYIIHEKKLKENVGKPYDSIIPLRMNDSRLLQCRYGVVDHYFTSWTALFH